MVDDSKRVVTSQAKREAEFTALLERLGAILKRNGLKNTHQREVILRLLFDRPGHHTPEQIHEQLKKEAPDQKIGIATIYRALSLLEKEGLISSISFGASGKKYELADPTHHDHMICRGCSKIIEFFDERIEEMQREIARRYQFEMEDHMMQIFGLCSECVEKGRK